MTHFLKKEHKISPRDSNHISLVLEENAQPKCSTISVKPMIRPFIDNHYQSRDVKFSSNKVLLYKVSKTKQRWGHLFLKKLNKNLKVFYLFKQIHDFTVARSAKNWLRLHIPSSDVTFAVVRLCSHIYLRRERSHSFTLAARTRQNFCNGYTDTDTDASQHQQ